MTARTVTGNTILLTGSAQAGQTVKAVKRYATISGVVITQSGVETDTTDASGNFSFPLDAPADGSTSWTLVTPDGSEFDFTLPYGDGSSVAVTTLIGAAAVDADAVTLLLDSYVPKSGSTMTGALAFSGTTHAGVKLLSLTTTQRDALTPANGMVIYNSTTGAVNAYQNGAWGALGGGSSAWGGITGTLADQTDLQTALNAKADDTDIGTTIQAYSAKTAAIAALTWAANSIILLTGTATASVQALAAHVVTFLQSASAADARTAIGAGTGSGNVTGPASSTDNAVARFDSTTGKIIQNSTVTIDDSGNLDIPGANTIAGYALRLNSTTGQRGFVDFSSPVIRVGALGGISLALWADSFERARITNTGIGIGVTANQGRIHSYDTGGGFLHCYKSGVVGSAVAVIANGTGDVTLCLSGTFTISDGAGNTAGGVITKTAPSGTFNLYDDGGTNTCQLQVAADGSVTVIRTAGSRTYAVNLNLNWM